MNIDAKPSDPFIFEKKTAYMQRVADIVRNGHHRYIAGTLEAEKAGRFAEKLHTFYGCNFGKAAAYRARKLGQSSSRLLFLSTQNQPDLIWILLVTEGSWRHVEAGREKWRHVAKERVELTGYELVRHIRPGNAKPSWTWRYKTSRYEEIRNEIIYNIRHKRDDELRKLIQILSRTPGFAGAREQIKCFYALIKSEWKRSRSKCEMPEIPKAVGYVRRVANKGQQLSKIVKEIKNAN